jgi:hypothetical protein
MSRVLAALVQVGQQTGAAVLALRHMNKNVGLDMIYRGLGSTGIIGTARSAMVVVDHPQHPGELLLATYKSNVGAKPKALGYRIAGHENGGGYLIWGDELDLTADQAMRGSGEQGDTEPERSEAESWLLELLKDGSMSSKQIYADAEDCGFTHQQVKRAKAKLRLRVRKSTGGDSHWRWELPEDKGTADQAPENMTPLTFLTPLAASEAAERGDAACVDAEERRRKGITSSLKEASDAGDDGKEVKGVKKVKNPASPPHGDAPSSSLVERSVVAAAVGEADTLPAPPAPTPITTAPSYHPPVEEGTSPAPLAPLPATQNLIPWPGRDQIDLESWPGPWCPECTEEPVRQENDLCPKCRLEVERLAERWRA